MTAARSAVRRIFARAGVLSFFVNILMLTGPIYMLQVYDRVLGSRSTETLVVITLLTVALFAAMAVIDLARGALLARAGDAFEKELKSSAFQVCVDAAGQGVPGADRPLADLRQVRQIFTSPALTGAFDAPWAPFFLLVVFLLHWLLGVVALLGLCALVALAFYNERSSRKANAAATAISADAERYANRRCATPRQWTLWACGRRCSIAGAPDPTGRTKRPFGPPTRSAELRRFQRRRGYFSNRRSSAPAPFWPFAAKSRPA